jgi:UDP-N-acetylmuramoyl-L-alanyl-D-glutamate--2,6-diaminopimelate ligase
MKLNDIIKGIECRILQNAAVDVKDIAFDSRKVRKGTLFVAQKGVHVDGHLFIDQAIAQGAVAVICQEQPATLHKDIVYIVVDNSDKALGEAASNYYGNPSSHLKLVGITGTNGKTTTVTLLHRMFRMQGFHTGLLSTIVNRIDEEEIPSTHTTPDALELNGLLKQMVDSGCQYCFMEVSSHSIVQQRIAGLTFAGGIFSNITHDHLDFHKTMANYIAAKKAFFDALPKEAFALTNLDDKNGMVMVQNTRATVKTYSLQHPADFKCKVIEDSFQGMHMELNGKEVWCRLVGRFNAQNLTAIYGAAVLSGIPATKALQLLSRLESAEGRFQHVTGRGIDAIVDYAHTPDALENVINTINEVRQTHQRLIVVVGCGGDRDPLKRPEMAKIAVRGADRAIFTSDNPRSEDPDAILDAMEAGLTHLELSSVVRITNRKQAIRAAVMMAHKGDIILVAGKGHEKYQEINGVRHHFDDCEELTELLKGEEENDEN